MKSKKSIVTICVVIFCILVSCNNISTSSNNDISAESSYEETLEMSFEDIYKNNDVSILSRKEVIIKIEMYEYLFRTFNITYDELREIYETTFNSTQNLDHRVMVGYSNNHPEFFTSSDFEKIKTYNFIGLSIDEMEKIIVESGYDLEGEKNFVKEYGKDRFSLSISEAIDGYANESYIFVLSSIIQKPDPNMGEYASYSLTKYIFKEVDGVHRLSSKLYKDGFTSHSINVFEEPVNNPELEKLIDDFISRNNLKDVNYDFQFDLKLVVEKLLDDGIE